MRRAGGVLAAGLLAALAAAGRVRAAAAGTAARIVRDVERLVRATLASLVETASRSRLRVRHLRITLTGDPEFARWSRSDAVPEGPPASRVPY